MNTFRLLQRQPLALAFCFSFSLAACGGSSDPTPLLTLDGQPPLIVAHRGASGYLPEETLEAYQKAIDLAASRLAA